MKLIELINSKEKAMVDDEDYEWLKDFTWLAVEIDGETYAGTIIDGKVSLMHNMIVAYHGIDKFKR